MKLRLKMTILFNGIIIDTVIHDKGPYRAAVPHSIVLLH